MDRFALDDVTVEDIIDRSRIYPDRSITVKAFVETWLIPDQHDYVVVDKGKLAGVVSLNMLRYLPRSEWETTLLERVLRQNTPQAHLCELVEDALERMTSNSLTVLPVIDKETGEFVWVDIQPRGPGKWSCQPPRATKSDRCMAGDPAARQRGLISSLCPLTEGEVANRRNIVDRLKDGDVLLMDGGTGSELQRRGVNVLRGATDRLKAWSATANVDNAEVVQQVHRDYLRGGRGHSHQQQLLDHSFGDGTHWTRHPLERVRRRSGRQRRQGKGRRESGCLRGGRNRCSNAARPHGQRTPPTSISLAPRRFATSTWSTRNCW